MVNASGQETNGRQSLVGKICHLLVSYYSTLVKELMDQVAELIL